MILEELARSGRTFRFHTPNGLHARLITREVAAWLRRANFATLRLGVETTALGEARLDAKLQAGELEAALAHLKRGGVSPRRRSGSTSSSASRTRRRPRWRPPSSGSRSWGATPILAEYSPIPGTALWPPALACSRFDLTADPLFHNNSLFPCWPQFSWERYTLLKRLAAG